MFHFIQVTNPDNNQKIPLDFQAFRIIGFDNAFADDYINNGDIEKTKITGFMGIVTTILIQREFHI